MATAASFLYNTHCHRTKHIENLEYNAIMDKAQTPKNGAEGKTTRQEASRIKRVMCNLQREFFVIATKDTKETLLPRLVLLQYLSLYCGQVESLNATRKMRPDPLSRPPAFSASDIEMFSCLSSGAIGGISCRPQRHFQLAKASCLHSRLDAGQECH